MKKKLLSGILLIGILLSIPCTQIDLASDRLEESIQELPMPESNDTVASPITPSENFTNSDGVYSLSLSSSVGTLTYYNQSDVRWAGHLYGGLDSMAAYGCGPTVMAMIISSFTEHNLLPSDMADWAATNHYWAASSGTKHNFIPECAAAFGLKAEPFTGRTDTEVRQALLSGHILVALMGPGHFTTSGHFIILYNYWSGNEIRIADPASLDRTMTAWDINLILNELNSATDYGGPIWMISPQ